ncbi:MAG: hypothetical protein OEY86_17170 [Nitrospira sp.]|nr:hypothetical protein [Nitrospira sp.]
MKKGCLLAGALTLLIMSSGASLAHADHAWGNYHWARTTTPFTLLIGDNTTGEWTSILEVTINDWATLAGNTISTTGATVGAWTKQEVIPQEVIGTAGKRCKAVLGTTQACNGKYGYNGWLGLAQIWVSEGHITQGKAKMNDSYFSKAKYNNPNEKRHVICQEIAHTFGLGHQSENFSLSLHSCMDYFSNTGSYADSTLSTIPNHHDYEQLSSIYDTHTDAASTVATTAAALGRQADENDPGDDNPRQWGRLLHQSANGRSSIYEQTLEQGVKIVRHVLWTEETATRCPACDHRFHDKD